MSRVDELVDDALGWFNADHDEPDRAVAKLVGALAMSIGQLAAAVEQLKAGLPAVAAVPAATAALGELPDWREMKVYVHDLQCQDPTCGESQIAWKTDATVRTLLARLAAHRRMHHPTRTEDPV